MSFTAMFYTFSKRINSTKQPGSGTDYSITLKDRCSALDPVIQLQTGQSENPTAFNYCYIPTFGRYYWVRWEWENRLWTAYCSHDAMASWKTYIGSYSGYVTRSASSHDGTIMDSYYPAKAAITETKNGATQDPSWSHDLNSGQFVIGVQGKSSGFNGGAVTYYAVSPSAVKSITDYLLDPQNLTVTDISDDLLKCIFNPMQFIVSCMWYPFTVATLSSDNIQVGWWDITTPAGSCKKLTTGVYTRNLSFTVPKHPQAATRGSYLNMNPFSTYVLNAGPWGVIPINTQHVMDETSLSCELNVDLFTGSGRLSIVAKDVVGYVENHMAQIGVPIQLGQNMLNQGALTSIPNDIVGGIGSAMSGRLLSGIAGSLVSGYSAISDIAALSQAIPQTIGSNGSMAFPAIFCIIGRFLTVVNEDNASHGRPLCQVKTLSSLSGYIMCEDADPAIPCTDVELKEIISYLNSGFYYE